MFKGDGERDDNRTSARFIDGDVFIVVVSLKFSISCRKSDDRFRPVAIRLASRSSHTSRISNEGLFQDEKSLEFALIGQVGIEDLCLPRIWV